MLMPMPRKPCYIYWMPETVKPTYEQLDLVPELSDPWHPLQPSHPLETGLQAGVDEVGIGPLAGPVVAGAVLLDPNRPIADLGDSKTLTPKRRKELAGEIRAKALAWSLGWAEVDEIDHINILRASHLAMQRAVDSLSQKPTMVLVDGNKTPVLPFPSVAVIQGDRRVPQIGAASIIAKVARDNFMCDLDRQYPGYGFSQHMGYPTKKHFTALRQLGATPAHRRSFAPVRDVLENTDPEQSTLFAEVKPA